MNFKESLNHPIFSTISIVADRLNFPTYVVGGWVRDLIIQRKRKVEDMIVPTGNLTPDSCMKCKSADHYTIQRLL